MTELTFPNASEQLRQRLKTWSRSILTIKVIDAGRLSCGEREIGGAEMLAVSAARDPLIDTDPLHSVSPILLRSVEMPWGVEKFAQAASRAGGPNAN